VLGVVVGASPVGVVGVDVDVDVFGGC